MHETQPRQRASLLCGRVRMAMAPRPEPYWHADFRTWKYTGLTFKVLPYVAEVGYWQALEASKKILGFSMKTLKTGINSCSSFVRCALSPACLPSFMGRAGSLGLRTFSCWACLRKTGASACTAVVADSQSH